MNASPTERNEVLTANRGLIVHIARRHPHAARHRDDEDDLIQTACMLFLERFHAFDGVHLRPFCRWAILGAAREMRRFRSKGHAPLPAFTDPATLDPPSVEADDTAACVRAAVEKLPRELRRVVTRYYELDGGGPATVEDLRDGQSASLIYPRLTSARAKLAAALAHLDDAERPHVTRSEVPSPHRPRSARRPGQQICRNCSKARVTRPRGLCWSCYYTPGVKERFPSTSKFTPNRFRNHSPGNAGDVHAERVTTTN